MGKKVYQLITKGEITDGAKIDQVKISLLKKIKIPEKVVKKIFSGKKVLVSQFKNESDAKKWYKQFNKIGLITKVRIIDEKRTKIEKKSVKINETENSSQLSDSQDNDSDCFYEVNFYGKLSNKINQDEAEIFLKEKLPQDQLGLLFSGKKVLITNTESLKKAEGVSALLEKKGIITTIDKKNDRREQQVVQTIEDQIKHKEGNIFISFLSSTLSILLKFTRTILTLPPPLNIIVLGIASLMFVTFILGILYKSDLFSFDLFESTSTTYTITELKEFKDSEELYTYIALVPVVETKKNNKNELKGYCYRHYEVGFGYNNLMGMFNKNKDFICDNKYDQLPRPQLLSVNAFKSEVEGSGCNPSSALK